MRFSSSATSYKAGEEVSFTLTSLGEYYSLKSVYYAEKGSSYPRVEISKDDAGLYSFLMPDFDITLNVESERLYSISFSGSHFSAQIEEEQSYYKSGKTISFVLTLDEGYMLSDEPSGTYLSISSTDSGTKSLGIHENEDGEGYRFIMPEGNVTITVPVEEKPVIKDDDPFTTPVTYVGTYSYTASDWTTYYSTITIAFSGDGMLTWGVTYYYEADDYYDWKDFNPLNGNARLDSSSVTVLVNTVSKKYTYDAENSLVKFSAPGRIEREGDKDWTLKVSSSKTSDGLPEALTFNEVIDSSVPQGLKSAGAVLYIK